MAGVTQEGPGQVMRASREGTLGRVIDACAGNARLIAGMTALFVWVWTLLQGSLFYADAVGVWEGGYPWTLSMFVFAFVFVGVGISSRWIDYDLLDTRVLVVVLVCMLLGACCTAASCHLALSPMLSIGLMFGGGVLVGVASPFYYLAFVRQLLALRVSQIIAVCSICTILASILCGTFFLLPPAVAIVVPALSPVAMFVVLWPKRTRSAVRLRREVGREVFIPWKLNLTAFVQGMGFEAGMSLCTQLNGNSTFMHDLVYVAGYAVAAIVLLVVSTVLAHRFDALIYKVGFPILALGTVLVPSLGAIGISCFISACGYRFIDILIWTLVIYLALSKRLSVNWMAGWSTCFFYLGMAVGQLLVPVLLGLFGPGCEQLVAALVGFAIMLTALLATSISNDEKAWGSLPSPDGGEVAFLEEALAGLASTWGLTTRQVDVTKLLALGMNKAQIADELGVSRETVKVHTRNIYAAAGVHSQDELADIVLSKAQQLRDALVQ